jgi:hypothetical protein
VGWKVLGLSYGWGLAVDGQWRKGRRGGGDLVGNKVNHRKPSCARFQPRLMNLLHCWLIFKGGFLRKFRRDAADALKKGLAPLFIDEIQVAQARAEWIKAQT